MDIKDKILKESQVLFWKYGVKSVTMDDISKHLGISKKTIYQYFQEKDEIVCMVTDLFMKEQVTDTEIIKAKANDPLEELYLLSNHIRETFQSMNPSLLFELKKYHPNAYSVFINHKSTCLLNSIVANLKTGMQQGWYRADLDVLVIAKLRMEQVEMAFDQEIFPAKNFSLQEVQLQFFNHFISGITTIKGHKLLNKYRHVQEEEV